MLTLYIFVKTAVLDGKYASDGIQRCGRHESRVNFGPKFTLYSRAIRGILPVKTAVLTGKYEYIEASS